MRHPHPALALCAALTCATLFAPPARAANPCGPVPQALILLDRSGSMTGLVGSQSKWSIAQSAIGALTTNFTGQLDFGLMLFSRWPHTSNCSSAKINVGVGPGTAGSISVLLSATYPKGDTPIALSLDSARSYLKSVKKSGHAQYVILITDGKETCQPTSVNTPQGAAGRLYSDGVKTYVVGFGAGVDPTSLSATAVAGGTSSYFKAGNYTQLDSALRKIAAAISCCGDGKLDPGELCDVGIVSGAGACPSSCNDNNVCSIDRLVGKACDAACTYSAITTAKNGDGCCPPGHSAATDSDCPPLCGNGKLDSGEKCDTGIPSWMSGHCPVTCDDNNACTQDVMLGSGCSVSCSHKNICPTNPCGNGKLDGGEKCDTAIPAGQIGACPTSCNDNNPNTKDTLVGSGCQTYCTHNSAPACGNGTVDAGEWCDTAIPAGQKGACPTSCNDNDPCTQDTMMGAGCLAYCTRVPITTAKSGDGCCPPGASNATDTDCPVGSNCGNGRIDPGESCDPGISSGNGACPKTCSDNDPCTRDVLGGSKCNVKCFHNPLGASSAAKDGCCPPQTTEASDPDCPPQCGPDKTKDCVDPCRGVVCKDREYCKYGRCVPWPSEADAGASGQPAGPGVDMVSGCDCALPGQAAEGALPGLLALLALALLRRRSSR